MARSKFAPGSKAGRANTSKEQVVGGNPGNPEVKPVTEEMIAVEVAGEPKTAAEAQASREPRKLEVVKNESRKNLLPINLDDEIRRRAYELYQQRGPGSGSEADDWINAEREVRERYQRQSA